MQVRVQENDCKGEDEDRVTGMQFCYDVPVALTISTAEHFDESLNFLGFPGHPKVGLELAQGRVDVQTAKVHLLREAVEHAHVEGVGDVAEVLADHLLRQALPRDQEASHGRGRVLQESSLYQVCNASLGLLVENVEPGSVMSFSYHLVHCVRAPTRGHYRGCARGRVGQEPGGRGRGGRRYGRPVLQWHFRRRRRMCWRTR